METPGRKKLLTALMFCAVTALAAAPQVFVQGSTSYQRNRVTRLEQSLNFTKQPMVSYWDITIDPGDVFLQNVKTLKVNTDSGYTTLGLNQTHLNEDFLIWHPDQDVRHLIAHEAGHLICECKSEEKANDIAYQLQFK